MQNSFDSDSMNLKKKVLFSSETCANCFYSFIRVTLLKKCEFFAKTFFALNKKIFTLSKCHNLCVEMAAIFIKKKQQQQNCCKVVKMQNREQAHNFGICL